MYIERKINPETNEITFLTANGREFKKIHVLVDNKPVVADIVQADTDEGWVDVEIPPDLTEKKEFSEGGDFKVKLDEKGKEMMETVPIFDPKVKRIVGKVKIYGDLRD